MYKLCKWLYQLGYDRGWDAAKQDERDKAQMTENLKRAVEAMKSPQEVEE